MKYIGIVFIVFVVGGFGGVMFDYVFFSKVASNPAWSQMPIVKSLDNRLQVIKNTEKIIVENSESIADIAARASTSVVYIESVGLNDAITGGNGVVLSSDGIVATTTAVVPIGHNVQYVKFADNSIYTVSKMYTDEYTGIVFLKTDSQNLASVSFANSDDAQNGKRLISISRSSVGNEARFSSGGLIGRAYDLSVGIPTTDYLQGVFNIDFTESVLIKNIGSPLVDYQGNMVGVISKKVVTISDDQDEYYAIAANDVYSAFERYLQNEMENDINHKQYKLGVNYAMINGIQSHAKDLPVDRGALISVPITRVEIAAFNNTLAAKSGLRGGDIIVMVNNEEVNAENNLSQLIFKHKIDERVELKVLRNNEVLSIVISDK